MLLWWHVATMPSHYIDAIASQITGVSIVYSSVCSGTDQRKHLSSASHAFVRGTNRWPVNFPKQRARNAENVSIRWRHYVREYIFTSWMFGQAEIIKFRVQIPYNLIPFIVSSCVFVHPLGRFKRWNRGLLFIIDSSNCKYKDQALLSFLLRFDIGVLCSCETIIKIFYCRIIIEHYRNNDRAIEITEM